MITPAAIVVTILVSARLLKGRRTLRPRRRPIPPLVGPRFLVPTRSASYTTWPTFTPPPVDPADEAIKALQAHLRDAQEYASTLASDVAQKRAAVRHLGVDGDGD